MAGVEHGTLGILDLNMYVKPYITPMPLTTKITYSVNIMTTISRRQK